MADSQPAALDDAADHLYGVPLGEFVAERKAAASAFRAAGDKDGAAMIASLPKASTSAWVVDLLVREKPDLVDSLTELGGSLREAKDDLDPAALRALGDQRRHLVAQIAAQAAALADERGQSVGPSVRSEVEQTLQAALADEGAAAAVRSGRLVRALETNGFDAVDVEGAVAGGGTASAPASRGRARQASNDADDLAAARRRKEELHTRRQDADEARAAVSAAQDRVRRADTARDEASASRDRFRKERDELRRRLDVVEEELSAATTTLRAATGDAGDAEDALSSAEDAADRAAARLSALEKRHR